MSEASETPLQRAERRYHEALTTMSVDSATRAARALIYITALEDTLHGVSPVSLEIVA